MRVVCYLRRDRSWVEGEFSKHFIERWSAKEIAKIWDETFRTTYLEFRQQLFELQTTNLHDVAFDAIVNQFDYGLPSDDIVVPTDDDDWFHPDVINTLRDLNAPLVYWNFLNNTEGKIVLQNPSKERIKFLFETNNYAISCPSARQHLMDHTALDNDKRGAGVHINKELSMHNRTIASISLLGEKLLGHRSPTTPVNPKNELLKLYETGITVEKHQDCPSYFDKYIDSLIVLHKNLKVRKVFF